jgi:replicative superfamily II helicase
MAAMQLESKQLCQAVQGGVAFHHGNLSTQDRAIIEALFLDRALAVRFEAPGITTTM